MKNEELSKRISNLEIEIQKLKKELENSEPSIFERFSVGSYICGLEIAESKPDSDIFQIAIYDNSGTMWWISTQVIDRLISCHDWIEKYHPFLEEYRKEWEYMEGSPVLQHTIASQKVGLWANKTPVKKPWEDA